MRVVLLVGDSYMAYLLTHLLFETDGHDVVRVVLSTRYRRSPARTLRLLQGRSARWIAYRLFVALKSHALGLFRGRSVARMAARHGIPCWYSSDFDRAVADGALAECDAAIAVNFDQIISESALALPPRGVYNIHASKLPRDRGVSPALWAYARGDDAVWVSYYRMDHGIDTGPLLRQIEVPIAGFRSAVRMYEHVCRVAGEELPGLLTELEAEVLEETPQSCGDENYNGIPGAPFDQYLRESRRRLVTVGDVLGVLSLRQR